MHRHTDGQTDGQSKNIMPAAFNDGIGINIELYANKCKYYSK